MHLTVLGEWQGNQGYLASIPMFLLSVRMTLEEILC